MFYANANTRSIASLIGVASEVVPGPDAWDAQVASDAPLHWYDLDSSGGLADKGSGAYALVPVAGVPPQYIFGAINGSYDYSGGNYWQWWTSNYTFPYTSDFTISMFVRRNGAPSATEGLATSYNAGAAYGGWLAALSNTGTLEFKGKGWGSYTFRSTLSNINVCDDVWHLIHFVMKSNLMSIYIDGIESTYTQQESVTGTTYPQTSAVTFSLGAYRTSTGSTQDYYTGKMDEVQIYASALSEASITLQAAAAGVTYAQASWDAALTALSAVNHWPLNEASGSTAADSIGTDNSTHYSTPVTSDINGPFLGSGYVEYDGTAYSQVASPAVISGGNITEYSISYWVLLDAVASEQHFLSNSNASASEMNVLGGLYNNGGYQIRASEYPPSADELLGITTPSAATWVHVVATRSATDNLRELYVDGVQKASKTMNTYTGGTCSLWTFGGHWNGSTSSLAKGMPGKLSNISLFDYRLTQANIDTLRASVGL